MNDTLKAMANNRERAIYLINQGNATRASLIEALEIGRPSLATIFTHLRMTGIYPIENKDKIFSLTDLEGHKAHKAQRLQKLSSEDYEVRVRKNYALAMRKSQELYARYPAELEDDEDEEVKLLKAHAEATVALAEFYMEKLS